MGARFQWSASSSRVYCRFICIHHPVPLPDAVISSHQHAHTADPDSGVNASEARAVEHTEHAGMEHAAHDMSDPRMAAAMEADMRRRFWISLVLALPVLAYLVAGHQHPRAAPAHSVRGTFWGSGDATGAFSLPLFPVAVLFYIGPLPAYRVFMVWVYDRTESLLVAMLMHASFTSGVLYVLMPVAIAELSLVTRCVVLAAVLWLLVAAVVVANHGQLARQPLARQAGRTEVAPPYVRPT